jgi:hypothetical protein
MSERRADDAYMTPPWCADIGARIATPDGTTCVLDPCAGEGALLDAVLRRKPVGVHGIELDHGRAGPRGYTCGDALTLPWPRCDSVLMNPPFSLWQPFVEMALIHAPSRVVVLLRLGALAGQKRAAFWKGAAENWGITVHVLSKRPSFTGGGNDSSDYAWVRFSKRLDQEGVRWV